jgi:hypothetical protein
MQAGSLAIAQDLKHARTLAHELAEMRMKVSNADMTATACGGMGSTMTVCWLCTGGVVCGAHALPAQA